MYHPQVVQSPIFNDSLKVNIDGHTRPKIVPKLLLQVPVLELHTSLICDPEYGGLKKAIYAENNIIISSSALCSILPPPIKTISALYKVMCGYECCTYEKSIYSSLLSWRDWYSKKSNIKAKIIKTESQTKTKIAYMKHIKYIHATWASYLCQGIFYGKGNNV